MRLSRCPPSKRWAFKRLKAALITLLNNQGGVWVFGNSDVTVYPNESNRLHLLPSHWKRGEQTSNCNIWRGRDHLPCEWELKWLAAKINSLQSFHYLGPKRFPLCYVLDHTICKYLWCYGQIDICILLLYLLCHKNFQCTLKSSYLRLQLDKNVMMNYCFLTYKIKHQEIKAVTTLDSSATRLSLVTVATQQTPLPSISQVLLSVFTLQPSGIKDVTHVLTGVNHELSMTITFV